MKSSSLQLKVLMIAAGAMLFVLAVSVFSLHRVYLSIEELDRISREDFQSQLLILKAHGAFKQQVQEWKNVLLRGRDPSLLAKHWKAFEAMETEAANAAKEARAGTSDEAVRALLQAFNDEHKAAAARYRKGLEIFKAASDPYAADASVTGIDRAPTQALLDASAKAEDRGSAVVLRAVKSADTIFKAAI